MRILFVAKEWDYGDPQRGHSFEWDTFYRTLVADGHEVEFLDLTDLRGEDLSTVESIVRGRIELHLPQIMLCVLFQEELPPAILARVRDQDGVPVVNWFCDDHWRYSNFSRRYAPALSLSVTTSSSAAERYARDEFPFLLSQWGYADKVYGLLPPATTALPQISFVGQPYGARAEYLKTLDRALSPVASVETFGFGSPKGRLEARQMIDLFNISAASINFSSSWRPSVLRQLIRREFVPRRVPPQLKARVFEVTGAGGLLITEPSEDLAEYFKVGEEVLVFNSQSELEDAARQAIEDPDWRLKIATAGFERCQREHTMSRRLDEVIGAVVK